MRPAQALQREHTHLAFETPAMYKRRGLWLWSALLLCLLCGCTQQQPLPDNFIVRSFGVDPQGHTLLLGSTPSNFPDRILMAVSWDGQVRWHLTSKGHFKEFAQSSRRLGVDRYGNVYAAGVFGGAATFGEREVPAQQAIFVLSTTAQGALRWVQTFGYVDPPLPPGVAGTSIAYPYDLTLLVARDALFLIGGHTHKPGNGPEQKGLMVRKLALSTGEALWTQFLRGQMGTLWTQYLDASGTLRIAGSFAKDAHFGTVTKSAKEAWDFFIVSIDAQGKIGDVAQGSGGSEGTQPGLQDGSLVLDRTGQLYFALRTVVSQNQAGTQTTIPAVGKLNANGDLAWVFTAQNVGSVHGRQQEHDTQDPIYVLNTGNNVGFVGLLDQQGNITPKQTSRSCPTGKQQVRYTCVYGPALVNPQGVWLLRTQIENPTGLLQKPFERQQRTLWHIAP